MPSIQPCIHRKRDGEELSGEEIAFLIDGYTNGAIPDYQASAFLMAVFFSGMTDREVSALTERMAQSGETVDLSSVPGVKVDKLLVTSQYQVWEEPNLTASAGDLLAKYTQSDFPEDRKPQVRVPVAGT